jgi:hypothetical protein
MLAQRRRGMSSYDAHSGVGDGAPRKDPAVATRVNTSFSPLHLSFFFRCLFFLGLASLLFLFGAAAMFFELPGTSFLRRAFLGGEAWYEQRQVTNGADESATPGTVGPIDRPDKSCDGFTLCMHGGGSRASLINMRGDVVHRWNVPFSEMWSDPPHLRGPIDDATVYFNDGHVYPNGDLVVVVEGPINTKNSSNGYGLAKLDKDSHIIWKYAEKCHHDVDVSDDGTIYTLANETLEKVPRGLGFIPTPCMVDCIDIVSPDGRKLKRISLLEALQDSPYSPLLCMLERPARTGGALPPGTMPSPFLDDARRRDVLHTNAVKVLNRALAPKFPLFKAGYLLVSLRHLDAIAVVDPESAKVVWAARGPWHAQHDPSFLENGHMLLFDNLGSPVGSRVLEFDPSTLAFPWSYPGDNDKPFLSRIRGMAQRLQNGNTLIVNSDGGEAFEVAPNRETVWSWSCGHIELNRARRYAPGELPFLEGVHRARP